MLKLNTISDLLQASGLLIAQSDGQSEVWIDHLSEDSRQIHENGLFVAVRGAQADGHRFLEKAVSNGAKIVVVEDASASIPENTAWVQVSNARAACARLSAALFQHPARSLKLIGVTGTNGKTTSTFLIHQMLQALGEKAGLIGTIEYRIGDEAVESTHTTPDAYRVNQMWQNMVDAGCSVCVMEVSSHALDQYRVLGEDFDMAVFSNLTHDHLDYHGTLEAYLGAKKMLFDDLLPDGFALTNVDDAAGEAIVSGTAANIIRYGQHSTADFRFEILEDRIQGLRMMIDGVSTSFRLVGAFNAYNLTAAYSVGRALGYAKDDVLAALSELPPVRGRFEQLFFSNGVTAIVDYAHTPDALENVLETIESTKAEFGKVWCIFGCGGDRDPKKRPVMGKIAESFADYPVITNDNPRTEDPMQIIREVHAGFEHPDRATVQPDRRAAIQHAVSHARAEDVILIAGKGHETYQIIGTEKQHFDDREEILLAFADRGIHPVP